MFFYSNEQRLDHNIKTITAFPAEDQAMIKANIQGTLDRADGYISRPLSWLATKTGIQKEFPETVGVITETFEKVIAKFAEEYRGLGLNLKSLTPTQIETLKDTLQNEIGLLEGMKNIQIVYHKRYETFPEKKEVLAALDDVIPKLEERVKDQGQLFADLIVGYHKEKGDSFNLSASGSQPKDPTRFTTQDAQSRLDAYLQKWCPNIGSSQEVRELISEGALIYDKLLKGEISSPQEWSKGDKRALTALSWFLMKAALKKGQGHAQGAFVIEDKDGKLYNFLLKAEGCGDRESSHFLGRSPQWTGVSKLLMKSSTHKGIDVLGLPAEKRHLLVGQVDSPFSKEKLLFLKFEDFSPFVTTAYGYDAAVHGADLVIAQYNKKFHPGSDDLPEMAKERVPAQLLKEFNIILKALDPHTLQELKEEMGKRGFKDEPEKSAKTWGIAYMTLFIQLLNLLPVIPKEVNTVAFVQALPSLDHLDLRTGKEVYFTQKELEESLKNV